MSKSLKNDEIKSSSVILINQEGKNLGKQTLSESLGMAKSLNLDLVQVQESDIPVCKIMDFNKSIFKIKKAKKPKPTKSKEIRFMMTIADNDLRIKSNQALKLLESGCRIKIVLLEKRRRINNQKDMEDKMNLIISYLGAKYSVDPKIERRDKMLSVWLP